MLTKKEKIINFFEQRQAKKSYVFMLLSCICWVSGYVYANQHNFSPVQTNLSRSIIMTIAMYMLCRSMNLNIEYKSPKSWRVLIKRHLAFVFQGLAVAGVQFILPLGIAHTLMASGPLFTLALQILVYKKGTISSKKLQGCLISVVGIILTSNGKFIYSYLDESFQFKTQFQNYVSDSYTTLIGGCLLIIVAMIVIAYGILLTQQAQCHAFEIVFHFAVMNLFVSSVCYLMLPTKRPASQMYQSLIWVGVFLTFAETLFNLSLNLAENIAYTTIVAFFNVAVGYSISILRYGQSIQIVSTIGTIAVLYGVSTIILSKQQPVSQNSIENTKFVQQIQPLIQTPFRNQRKF